MPPEAVSGVSPRHPIGERRTVLHLITGLTVGGAETMLAKLVAASDRVRFRHVVVSMTPGGAVRDRIAATGIPVQDLGMRPGSASLAALRRLRAIVRAERPDAVQAWMYHANVMATVGTAGLGVPVLWNIRAAGLERHRVAAWSRLLAGRPAVVVVNSHRGLAHHEGLGYRPRRWEVLPNGFDVEAFRPDPTARAAVRAELGLDDGVPLAAIVARFDPQKDHRTLCAACGLARRRVPGLRLLVAGPGCTAENAELGRWIADAGLSDAVHLLGPRSDAAALFNACDVAVSSSAYGEGFSNSIGEAMACGVPNVVTDVGDSARIVSDTGVVVPPRDPEALGAAIADVLERPAAARRALGDAARARAVREYALPAIVARYEALYEAVTRAR